MKEIFAIRAAMESNKPAIAVWDTETGQIEIGRRVRVEGAVEFLQTNDGHPHRIRVEEGTEHSPRVWAVTEGSVHVSDR